MLRWAQIAPVCPGKPQILGWTRGHWRFILLVGLWPLEWASGILCGQLSGCSSGGPGSGSVRQCIIAQVRLYNLGTFECRVGLFSFNVPGSSLGNILFLEGRQSAAMMVRIAKLVGFGARSVRTEV